MAAPVEYEVREEYQDYPLDQLLEAPVTCFHGVGEIQSELLNRYFNVSSVRDLANMAPFVEALAVQETILEGGEVLNQTILQAGESRRLNFHIRQPDQGKKVVELSEAPVHVLDGLSPGQDLALYDSFRITNLTHLAHNRIMLEARVINYLAGQESGEGGTTAQSDAVAAILGARAATASSGQQRALSGEFSDASRLQALAGQVTDHVRERVDAMRGRALSGQISSRVGAGDAAAGLNRLDSIREGRDQGGSQSRGEDLERLRGSGDRGDIIAGRGSGSGVSRTDQILSSRGGTGLSGDSVQSISERRASEGGGRPSTGSRADSVLAARQSTGVSRPSTGAGEGAMVRTRTATAEKDKEKEIAAKEAKETTLPTEEEIKEEREKRRTRQAPGIDPVRVGVAAAVVLAVLAGLIIFLVTRGGSDEPAAPDTVATTETEQTSSGAAQPDSGQTAATTTTPTEPPRIRGVHLVQRGDTLWRISTREYADPLNWPSIFVENKDQIDHPDLIYPAQEFRIPSNPEYRFPDVPGGYTRTR